MAAPIRAWSQPASASLSIQPSGVEKKGQVFFYRCMKQDLPLALL